MTHPDFVWNTPAQHPRGNNTKLWESGTKALLARPPNIDDKVALFKQLLKTLVAEICEYTQAEVRRGNRRLADANAEEILDVLDLLLHKDSKVRQRAVFDAFAATLRSHMRSLLRCGPPILVAEDGTGGHKGYEIREDHINVIEIKGYDKALAASRSTTVNPMFVTGAPVVSHSTAPPGNPVVATRAPEVSRPTASVLVMERRRKSHTGPTNAGHSNSDINQDVDPPDGSDMAIDTTATEEDETELNPPGCGPYPMQRHMSSLGYSRDLQKKPFIGRLTEYANPKSVIALAADYHRWMTIGIGDVYVFRNLARVLINRGLVLANWHPALPPPGSDKHLYQLSTGKRWLFLRAIWTGTPVFRPLTDAEKALDSPPVCKYSNGRILSENDIGELYGWDRVRGMPGHIYQARRKCGDRPYDANNESEDDGPAEDQDDQDQDEDEEQEEKEEQDQEDKDWEGIEEGSAETWKRACVVREAEEEPAKKRQKTAGSSRPSTASIQSSMQPVNTRSSAKSAGVRVKIHPDSRVGMAANAATASAKNPGKQVPHRTPLLHRHSLVTTEIVRKGHWDGDFQDAFWEVYHEYPDVALPPAVPQRFDFNEEAETFVDWLDMRFREHGTPLLHTSMTKAYEYYRAWFVEGWD